MVENYDLKVKQTTLASGTDSNLIDDEVPAGMKRYITYIKYNNAGAAQTIDVTDSPTSGDYDATGYATLDKQKLAAGDTIMFPDNPNPDAPIMSVEAGHYLVGHTDVDDSMNVTVQYYDE